VGRKNPAYRPTRPPHPIWACSERVSAPGCTAGVESGSNRVGGPFHGSNSPSRHDGSPRFVKESGTSEAAGVKLPQGSPRHALRSSHRATGPRAGFRPEIRRIKDGTERRHFDALDGERRVRVGVPCLIELGVPGERLHRLRIVPARARPNPEPACRRAGSALPSPLRRRLVRGQCCTVAESTALKHGTWWTG
jgi:hypothetical protein